MKEANIRGAHRTIGLMLALFIILQVSSGIMVSLENLIETYWGGILHDIHKGYGYPGNIYRIVIGAGMLWMVVSGAAIALKIRARRHKRSQ